jgi:hypothetical protein
MEEKKSTDVIVVKLFVLRGNTLIKDCEYIGTKKEIHTILAMIEAQSMVTSIMYNYTCKPRAANRTVETRIMLLGGK